MSKNVSEEIKKILKDADAFIILTGAGMGVDSGLSVFRVDAGLWEKFPEAEKLNLSFEDLANPTKYQLHPEVIIPFYLERLRSYKQAEPHDGYYDLIEYAQTRNNGYFAVTSNVDGFFQKSYLNPDNVYEIHGSINKWQCSNFNCSKKHGLKGLVELSIEYLNLEDGEIKLTEDLKSKITCKHCRNYLRPNLLMFFDLDWYDLFYVQQMNLFENFKHSLYDSKVAIIEIGAGEKIRSIKNASEMLAESFKTKVIRINPEISVKESTSDNVICIKSSGLAGITEILSLIQ